MGFNTGLNNEQISAFDFVTKWSNLQQSHYSNDFKKPEKNLLSTICLVSHS